jgi:hypothetical protein
MTDKPNNYHVIKWNSPGMLKARQSAVTERSQC